MNLTKAALDKRLEALHQAEAETLAQLHAIQGAIAELEQFWAPLLAEQAQTAGESQLDEIRGGYEAA